MVMADMKEHAKERVVGSNLFIVIIHGDYFANVDQPPFIDQPHLTIVAMTMSKPIPSDIVDNGNVYNDNVDNVYNVEC